MRARVLCALFTLLLITVPITFLLVSCGGGGGSGGSQSATGSSGSGSVALLLADGPAEEYDQIWITITEVLLIPAEGNSQQPVVIYRNPTGITVDLLKLRDEDFLLTVKKVRSGVYNKIRLLISDIQPEGGVGPCNDFKLSSGKIDLNPQRSFEVVRGETLAIRLDMDVEKSIHSSKACTFRPVVFVDIEELDEKPDQVCPQILSGTIGRLIRDDVDNITGFILDLDDQVSNNHNQNYDYHDDDDTGYGRGELEVRLLEDTAIFDQDGQFSGPYALEGQQGQKVKVRGRLNDKGALEASVVALGDLLKVKGLADGPVDETTDLFPLIALRGEELVGKYSVDVANETLVLIGCDAEVGKEAIQAGMIAEVIGKLVNINGENTLRSVVVFLRAREISGQITLIENKVGGKIVTVDQTTGGEVDVFVPSYTPINIEGDGSVPRELFCEGRQVRIFLDPDTLDPLTATLVLVKSERREGVVSSLNGFDRTLYVDGESVYVQPSASILDTRGTVDTLVDFEEIDIGDQLEYYGLEACPGDTGFTAFVILITG